MTPPILDDLDALLAPIPGDNPAGQPVSFLLRQQLDAARKSINPADFSPTDPLRPTEPKPADWPEIIRVTRDVLARQSKDLMTAARLTEAATKLHGFAGLRDGLTLLRRLIAEAWDRLTPPIEDNDYDVRASPFNWLDDPDRGARFPYAVRALPLLEDADGPITWQAWKDSQTALPPPADDNSYEPPENPAAKYAARFDKAVAACPRAHCQDVQDDTAAALAEIEALSKALDDRLADNAPGMGEVRKALIDCHDLAKRILAKKPAPIAAPPPVAAPQPAADAAGAPAANGAVHAPARRMATRDDVYAQLAEAAALLQQLEPHSPIPFMVQRAVALGRLPFPELIKVMIRDPGVVAQLSRELGLEAPTADNE